MINAISNVFIFIGFVYLLMSLIGKHPLWVKSLYEKVWGLEYPTDDDIYIIGKLYIVFGLILKLIFL